MSQIQVELNAQAKKSKKITDFFAGNKPRKQESVSMEVEEEEEDFHNQGPTGVSRRQAFHIVVIGCVISNLSSLASMSNVIDYR